MKARTLADSIAMPSVYAATRAELASLVLMLSGELIGRGIRVNAVSPRPIATPLRQVPLAGGRSQGDAAAIQSQIPAKRFVAQAVVFFASNESAFTVGSELVIDGGMSNLSRRGRVRS